jgi:glutamate carboxypeptidase
MDKNSLIDACRNDRSGQTLECLRQLVLIESPSHDKPALDHLCRDLAGRLARVGCEVETIPNAKGGDHLLARLPGIATERPALVLGHFDTVWPIGTLGRMPFRTEANRAYGPGIYDMKASLAIVLRVLELLGAIAAPVPRRPIWVLFTSDEEIGSPTSRKLIEQTASQCAYALVIEPPLADGGLKTSRKGVGRYHLEIEGKAAHAGVAPKNGRSAVVELAHQVLALEALQDHAAGTTLNVGVIQGGTTSNVVPAHASAEIDVRATSLANAQKLDAAIHSLKPITQEVKVTCTGGFNRPPMERTPGVAMLLEQAQQLGHQIGLTLTEGSTGGGSDGNFTAAIGVPTLDGLGVRGAGAHADDEHIEIDALDERATLLLLLLLELRVEP